MAALLPRPDADGGHRGNDHIALPVLLLGLCRPISSGQTPGTSPIPVGVGWGWEEACGSFCLPSEQEPRRRLQQERGCLALLPALWGLTPPLVILAQRDGPGPPQHHCGRQPSPRRGSRAKERKRRWGQGGKRSAQTARPQSHLSG